jgi:hypothetical protein
MISNEARRWVFCSRKSTLKEGHYCKWQKKEGKTGLIEVKYLVLQRGWFKVHDGS